MGTGSKQVRHLSQYYVQSTYGQATYEDNGSDKDNDSENTFIANAVQRHWVNYTSTRHIINV